MTTFFTADTHFGDHRTINIWRRPFGDSSEMDAVLVERWNATVSPDDEVWHLGDFARRADTVHALLERLHGRKHLVRGNNDPEATRRSRVGRASATISNCRWTATRWSCATIPSAAGMRSTAVPSTFTDTATGGSSPLSVNSMWEAMCTHSRP